MLHEILLASYSSTVPSLADPSGSSVLVAAVYWVQATLLGTLATTIAIIAIASVGLMMLAGRVNIRHGLTVIVGSFVLFGASAIVVGIQSSLGGGNSPSVHVPVVAAPPLPPPPMPPRRANRDPYAGAAMPAH